jgi:hypothetical protein
MSNECGAFVPSPLVYPHFCTLTGWITRSTLALGERLQQAGQDGRIGGRYPPLLGALIAASGNSLECSTIVLLKI